jgi:hypothetical protein
MFLALCIIAFAVIGLGLGVWHRNLMIELHASNPDVWQRLGSQDITGRFWPLSPRWPIWSWGSIFFFVAKRYERLGDSTFSAHAAPFRLAYLGWLIGLFVTAILIYVFHLAVILR